MSSKLVFSLVFLLSAAVTSAAQHDLSPRAVVLDEDVWVTFYDLPARRFRAIRTAILKRDIEAAARDLIVTANYVSVEAERAATPLQAPLRDIVAVFRQLSEGIENVTLTELDSTFGRTHWLLAQHYLVLARYARDTQQHRNASLYLWATTHHLERSILWSDVAVTRGVRATIDDLRDIADRLQDPKTAAKAFKERPVVRAEKLLRKIGKQIDRRVLLRAAKDTVREAPTAQTESR